MSRHRAGVLGKPIAHSLSPILHRAAYAALELDWTYEAFEVDEAGLAAFLGSRDGTWAGLSLTMPLKSAVIPLLSDVEPTACLINSVNTVLPTDGGWYGTNTDIDGIVSSIRPHVTLSPSTAIVLGAGATARSAIAALARLGVTDVLIRARRPEAADALVRLARRFDLRAQVAGLEPVTWDLSADIVVSTLPGDSGAPFAECVEGATGILLDSSYHPWPSPLASAWPNERVASGRDMLLWQAVEQVRLMTGRDAPVAAMEAALRLEG